jgi:hypothetical protein
MVSNAVFQTLPVEPKMEALAALLTSSEHGSMALIKFCEARCCANAVKSVINRVGCSRSSCIVFPALTRAITEQIKVVDDGGGW